MVDESLVGNTATELPETEENVSDDYRPLPTSGISGKSGDLDWEIDKDGTLTISNSGDYACSHRMDLNNISGLCVPEWCLYGRQIKKAVITADNFTSTACMFAGCSGLTKLDVSSFNTENPYDKSVFL